MSDQPEPPWAEEDAHDEQSKLHYEMEIAPNVDLGLHWDGGTDPQGTIIPTDDARHPETDGGIEGGADLTIHF